MSALRSHYLQQLGITEWVRRGVQSELASLPCYYAQSERVVLLAQHDGNSEQTTLFEGIAQAMGATVNNDINTIEDIQLINSPHTIVCLGESIVNAVKRIECLQKNTVLHTHSLQEMLEQSSLKRPVWQLLKSV